MKNQILTSAQDQSIVNHLQASREARGIPSSQSARYDIPIREMIEDVMYPLDTEAERFTKFKDQARNAWHIAWCDNKESSVTKFLWSILDPSKTDYFHSHPKQPGEWLSGRDVYNLIVKNGYEKVNFNSVQVVWSQLKRDGYVRKGEKGYYWYC